MSATLPVPRANVRPLAGRTPAKPRKESLKRERHQADYTILVVVIGLIAIGILMVYSSSAMKARSEGSPASSGGITGAVPTPITRWSHLASFRPPEDTVKPSSPSEIWSTSVL